MRILNYPFKTPFQYRGENYYIGKPQDILIIALTTIIGLSVLLVSDIMSTQNILKLISLLGALYIAFAIGVPSVPNGRDQGDYGEDYYLVVMRSSIMYFVGLLFLIGASLLQLLS